MAAAKGMAARNMTFSGTLASSLMTNRFTPKGGVMVPMFSRMTMSTPNQTRFQSYTAAMGRKMGTHTRSRGSAGTKQPSTIMTTTMASMVRPPESSREAMPEAMTVGMRLNVMK